MGSMVHKSALHEVKESNRKLRERIAVLEQEVATHKERATAREKERDEWRDEYDVAIVAKKRAEGALREVQAEIKTWVYVTGEPPDKVATIVDLALRRSGNREKAKPPDDIVEVVGRHMHLERSGDKYKGLCPFHKERTPSFNVDPVRQGYRCFGCGASGDATTFLIEMRRKERGKG